MSEVLITSLQKRIDDLTAENATLRAEAKDRRLKGKALRDELDQVRSQTTAISTERDDYKARLDAKPGELQAEIEALRGKLRDRDHRDTFRRLAAEAGVKDARAVDDLWTLSGYKAAADHADEPQIKAAITEALKGRDWLKTAPPSGDGKGSAQAGESTTSTAGPGNGRGGLVTGTGRFSVSKTQLRDREWMRTNQAAYAAALAEGAVDVSD